MTYWQRMCVPLNPCIPLVSKFENIMTKEEIAQNEHFLLLPQCFPLLFIGYPFNYRDFLFLTKYVKSRLLQICHMRERVKQITLNPSCANVLMICFFCIN